MHLPRLFSSPALVMELVGVFHFLATFDPKSRLPWSVGTCIDSES
jgi:hypothetical protein